MNNSAKSKSKKIDKSPKATNSSGDTSAKGSSGCSTPEANHGPTTPSSKPGGSTVTTPAQSPAQPKQEQSASHSLGGSAGLLSPSTVKPSPTLWFTTEIQHMMYGFGDCRKPLAESASLVEEIVHQQMTALLFRAEDVAHMRTARFIGIEDFIFLLRKDKIKLRRLLRYMSLKDVKSSTVKSAGLEEEDLPSDQGSEIKQQPRKRRKICHDFLSAIDQTGELLSLMDDDSVDEIKHERALRAELHTRNMDTQQYIEFCEARQASFAPRYKIQKFKDWLMAGVSLDIKPNLLAMEVLSYLAYETVAQVVDMVLLIKRDQMIDASDPLSLAGPQLCVNHDTPPDQSSDDQPSASTTAAATAAAVGAALKSPTGQKPSPTSSPPVTPTTPGSLTSSSGHGLSTPYSATKARSKKKKKAGSSTSRDVFTSQAITPTDIREAMRRYGQCIGPFADFYKCPLLNPTEKLLCC